MAERIRRRSRKAQRLLRLIVYAYLACVMPPFIVYLLFTFAPWLHIERTLWFHSYPWLTFLNSAINPCIFFFLSKEARIKAKSYLDSHCDCCYACCCSCCG